METTTDIEYDQMGRLLESSALAPSPSEAHGMLCGLICGGAPDPERAWLDQVLPLPAPDADAPDAPDAQARDDLSAFARQTQERIGGPALGFALLLPDDDRPLAQRATALYDWVRGFLFSLGIIGIKERDLSDQAREVLRDFANITRMDLDVLPDDEENEVALTELTEFVWVAAMLIYEERAAARARPR
ncbi:UPF0149 family protein [uncultured Thiodictyon sp.]|uniref:UPF0149 family protein n=1 Tax=uncultured Thiodictyon sp. TaxID=1846217 RepID=UPI0025F1AF38|nr:UPF0149 family protein [uncultured Thiodictyon sp.]